MIMKLHKIAILGSTRGTHLVTLLDAIHNQRLRAEIVIVISDQSDAGILNKARNYHLDNMALPLQRGESRIMYDQRLAAVLLEKKANLIILIGFMKILSVPFIKLFEGYVINVHPSLLPKYQGLRDLAVHQAVLEHRDTISGCSVHRVTELVDQGEILIQKQCKVRPDDIPETLKARVQALEAEALIEAIKLLDV